MERNSRKKMFIILLFMALLSLFFLFPAVTAAEAPANKALIYKSAACGHCIPYLEELNEFLIKHNFSVIERDVINDMQAREEVNKLNQLMNVPFEMQGHMMTILNGKLVLEGHVPASMLEELVKQYPDYNFPYWVVKQDSMGDDFTKYYLMKEGLIKKCEKNKPVKECAEDVFIKGEKPISSVSDNSVNSSSSTSEGKNKLLGKSLLYLVLINGFLAGLHPCTIAVLLFFIALLFTLRQTKLKILEVGGSFIGGVFLAYLLIGVGAMKALSFSEPHLAAKVGAGLIILLGLINIAGFFFKGKINLSLGIPTFFKPKMVEWAHKASVPFAFLTGIIVGICSFGCTAGIYLAILNLLLLNPSSGFFYLVFYNVMFILPLIVILLAVGNQKTLEKLEKIEQTDKAYIKLVSGIVMILMGLGIIYFIV